jgi:predicted acyl esterase
MGSEKMRDKGARLRGFGVIGVALVALVATMVLTAGTATAAPPTSVFNGNVPCSQKADGATFCNADPRSTVATWDGVPIDVDAAFPSVAKFGAGPYPLIGMFHGYGQYKVGFSDMQHWLNRGYATFSMTDRGFYESCGSPAARAAGGAACNKGYIRLLDDRYEVRDAQFFMGKLADEGLIQPTKIGATGPSYGGGMSMALAALRNRTMMPDGSLVPWKSPDGTPMEIAAATPLAPWTDLAASLEPNGSTLDYIKNAPYAGPLGDAPFGVMKESITNGLYFAGATYGYYAPEGSDPEADVTGWRSLLLAGEPYGQKAWDGANQITTYHSSYYIDHSIPPAPILMTAGFTDDIFPVTETVRYFNRTRSQYPNDSHLALLFGDFGHQRAQNKAADLSAISRAQTRWMDYWVKGTGNAPREGVTARTQTCPSSAPSGGPYRAPSWAKIAKGEVRYSSNAKQTIAPDGGDPAVAAQFEPVGSPGACATAPGNDEAGTANYRLDPTPDGGFTMLGSPTVIAKFGFSGDTAQVAARLLDVGPDGKETLVSRALWRPLGDGSKQVFQLYANGWHFDAGHVAKLELLPDDWNDGIVGGYSRPTNDQPAVTVSNLKLRLPTRDKPGSLDGLVGEPAAKVLPDGYKFARDFKEVETKVPHLVQKELVVKKGDVVGKVKCPEVYEACHDVVVSTKVGKAQLSGKVKATSGGDAASVKLTSKRPVELARGSTKVKVTIDSAELNKPVKSKAHLRG